MNKNNPLLISAFLLLLAACGPEKPDVDFAEKEQFLSLGDSLTRITFDTLSKTLKLQMAEGGPLKAIEFCNVQAYPLTQTYSQAFGAEVKRTSEKFRNPANAPDKREREVLKLFEQQPDLKQHAEKYRDGRVRYYKPIIVQELCLTCHGNTESFSSELKTTIKEKYPKDQAINYKPGDLRGMWSVTFLPGK